MAASTGRIGKTLSPELAAMLFGKTADAAIDEELPWMTEVDRAHVVMLAEGGVMATGAAAAILREIDELRGDGFAALRGRPAPRGLYLLYESHLVEKLGAEVGGALHTARSRNDLSATVLRLRMRQPVMALLEGVASLVALLSERGARFAAQVMPIYTHFQAAMPVSLGHYCRSLAAALARDLRGLVEAVAELERCPLGAGAVGGTSLPIAPQRTAALLGFAAPVASSIDAVASRDLVLRLFGAMAVLGVTLSRAAADLLQWTTAEFGFLQLPDELVGSSSMMPQKRNPFLLEHVLGRASAPAAAFAHACTAMHGAPFSNSIAVGTEAMRPLWSALRETGEAVTLLRAVVEGMEPDGEAMQRRARAGHVCATRLAEWLVQRRGVPFRDAHHQVGALVTRALAEGVALPALAAQVYEADELLAELEPAAACRAARFGGGPGDAGEAMQAEVGEQLALAARWTETQTARWSAARQALDQAARQLARRDEAPHSTQGARS